ncbi:Hypp1448 [Branchiostoma lanceolatum]|uniref:Hypp1448 protein n=1 Tax=Branchiostoma lanceolatum TaxID=7740 RepID=A0A8J9ZI73_BRALA|nr:Hypp1448 [Branchiostoma lanceolatum]
MRRCKSSKRPHQQVRVYVLASHLLNGPSLSRGGQRSRRRSNPSPTPVADMSGKQSRDGYVNDAVFCLYVKISGYERGLILKWIWLIRSNPLSESESDSTHQDS